MTILSVIHKKNLLLIFRLEYCIFVQIAYTVITSKKGDGCMAGSTTNISIRMDSALKAQADRLFGELGTNLTTAFNIFVRQSLRAEL